MKKVIIILLAVFLCHYAEAQTTFDRTHQPEAGPAPVISFKDPVIYKFPNGMIVLVVEDHRLPRVSASFYIDAGLVTEGKKAGAYGLMGQMLNEGTAAMPKAQFDEAVDKLGADVSLNSSGGKADALTRYFPQALELLSQGLQTPAFRNEEFEKLRSQALTGKQNESRNVKAVSGQVVNALLYGTDNPMGEFSTEETIKNLTLDDVKSFYNKYITPSRSYLTIVGDIKPALAKQLAEKLFVSWKGSNLALPVISTVKNPVKTVIDLVDMPNAVQSEITVSNLITLKLNDPDLFAAKLANAILGGGAEAYLFKSLREKRGFTYGAYSTIGSGRFQETFKANAAVRTAKTDSAVTEFLAQITKIRSQAVSEEDLKNAKARYNGSFALNMEDPQVTASYSRNILINNLPKDYYQTYLQKINAVSVADVQFAAQKYFGYDNTRVIVVGNAGQVRENLKRLPFEVKEYDRFAQPVAVK
ncbi:insulinase family protein [Mucilaginibacter sp. ZT4R22]|uniref:Insulinase family protein n=1 Tax=Mucilaginibacter pankratovii TaxID=2772110 RepID=A0ABR7WWC9_9SPHI|nr:pitrilysin family protein [Mucilaginibacter pankratovii]MBD1366585.1 insulinase family protein [Mucilaginibacter pankratovii]